MKPSPSSPSRFAAGHRARREGELRGVLGVHPDLLQVAAALEAGHAALDDEQADAVVARVGVGPGGDDHQVGQDAVGDEGLLAVEDPVVAVADGGGPDALQVAAGSGLGHRDRGDDLAGAVPGSQRCFCSSVASSAKYGAVDVVVHGEPRPVGAGHRQFLVQAPGSWACRRGVILKSWFAR